MKNILEIKKEILCSKKIPLNIYSELTSFIWNNIASFKIFKNNEELNNFLAYMMRINIKTNNKTKSNIVNLYKNIFAMKTDDEKYKIMNDIVMSIFCEFEKDELIKLENKIFN